MSRKTIWGWALYDWANSAFATTVMAGFFPVFFKGYWSYGSDVNLSTAQLGIGNSIASLTVALMAPILGAIADHGGRKKAFLLTFAYLGVLMTAGLYLVDRGQWLLAIFVYSGGVIGFSGANVFYDALLPAVAPADRLDSISSFGFAMGYLGGGLLFLLNVIMTLKPGLFGLPDAAAAVRLSFLSVALWWGGFTLFTLFWVKETPAIGRPAGAALVRQGIARLAGTLTHLRHLKSVGLFLIAYWCYIDGVDTIIRMAVDYGMSLGFAASDLILALLIVQFVGFPAALGFGWLSQRWGVRQAIYLAIVTYMGITVWGTMMTHKNEFYILAVIIGLVQGGIQALSRSYYARLIPKDKAAEFFGFYNMLGKFAAIFGPALMGIVGIVVRRVIMPTAPTAADLVAVGHLATRWSMGSLLVLFVTGLVLFSRVDEKKARAEIAALKTSTDR
ncbi:MAG: MFS transporter [Pseudomonadota bacterium]